MRRVFSRPIWDPDSGRRLRCRVRAIAIQGQSPPLPLPPWFSRKVAWANPRRFACKPRLRKRREDSSRNEIGRAHRSMTRFSGTDKLATHRGKNRELLSAPRARGERYWLCVGSSVRPMVFDSGSRPAAWGKKNPTKFDILLAPDPAKPDADCLLRMARVWGQGFGPEER